MPAKMSIVGPSQSRLAERLLCARHGSRHRGTHWEKQGYGETNTILRNPAVLWSMATRRVCRCPHHVLPAAGTQSLRATRAPDPCSAGPTLAGRAQSCPRASFRGSAELWGPRSLWGCLGWMARLLTAFLSPASVFQGLLHAAGEQLQGSMLSGVSFHAQMAGTLAECGPASQGRDASGTIYPFP